MSAVDSGAVKQARLRVWRGTSAVNGRYDEFEVPFEDGDSVLDGLCSGSTVLLLDAFEWFAPLEAWLHQDFLPQLGGRVTVVIAGRWPPSAAWRTSPVWHGRLRVVGVGDFQPDEARALLAARGVPEARWAEALTLTRGHPLGLALLSDVLSQRHAPRLDTLAGAPDVVKVLLERFLDDLPSPRHRRALEVCAFSRTTNEGLLEAVLDEPDADVSALFSWLCNLSFIRLVAHGVFPHDLARDVILANLQWRNPDAYRRLFQRLWRVLEDREASLTGREQAWATAEAMYLCRHSPTLRGFLAVDTVGAVVAGPATPEERDRLIGLLREQDGEASARVAAHWAARQPQAFSVLRGPDGVLEALGVTLRLTEADPADLEADPAIRAAWAFLQRAAPLRPGEVALYHRFFKGKRAPERTPEDVALFAQHASQVWLNTPNLAWSFLKQTDPNAMASVMNLIRHAHATAADFTLDAVDHAVFAHDWRAEPYREWSNAVARMALSVDFGAGVADGFEHTVSAQVMTQAEFAEAIRHALRDFRRPHDLARNPLMRARIVLERSNGQATPDALQTLLREAAESLKSDPRDSDLYRVLERTHFEPAATKELAAEVLGWSYSTYRRRLMAATACITGLLWQRELAGGKD